MIVNDKIELILEEILIELRKQTDIIGLWMHQDKNYHEKTLKKL